MKADFSLPADTKYLVVGHSHPECSMNDSLIDNLYNLSKSAESYLYTLSKLNVILGQNPELSTIFLEFSNNQISKKTEKWIKEGNYLGEHFPLLSPFMEGTQHRLLFGNNFKEYLYKTATSINQNTTRIVQQDFFFTDELGGYYRQDIEKVDSLSVALKTGRYPEDKEIIHELSTLNLIYLKKIISLCEQKNKRIFLIRCPQHPLEPNLRNEEQFQRILNKDFNHVEFLDFNEIPLENSHFVDFGHLNHKGATLFSNWFNGMLKKGLLEAKNKQEFINTHAREVNSEFAINSKLTFKLTHTCQLH